MFIIAFIGKISQQVLTYSRRKITSMIVKVQTTGPTGVLWIGMRRVFVLPRIAHGITQ